MGSKMKRISISNEHKILLKKNSLEDRQMTHDELKNWFNQNYKSSITRSTVTKILKNISIESNNSNLRFKKNRNPKLKMHHIIIL